MAKPMILRRGMHLVKHAWLSIPSDLTQHTEPKEVLLCATIMDITEEKMVTIKLNCSLRDALQGNERKLSMAALLEKGWRQPTFMERMRHGNLFPPYVVK